jgi:hypothetical protein
MLVAKLLKSIEGISQMRGGQLLDILPTSGEIAAAITIVPFLAVIGGGGLHGSVPAPARGCRGQRRCSRSTASEPAGMAAPRW